MDKKRFDRIITLLLPEMGSADARKALVEGALYGSTVLDRIEWEGAARPFTVRLVRLLHDYGEITVGKPALIALLEELRGQVGTDRQAHIDALITEMSAPPAEQALTPPPNTFNEGDLYVFLSYARPDQAVAEKVEAFLKAAGARVFRDVSEIREGANWDMTIETALRECGRMVLLLSAASMPYRKEVHREWFYFDQKRKPIYPLYIQECDLHSRLYAYNYIDARPDLGAALNRLLTELGRDFDLPDASTGADVIGVFPDADVPIRTLPQALADLLAAVRDPDGSVVLSVEQASAIKDHKPADLTEYRLGRIAEWSLPRYALDNRFVNLTLLLDKGESDPQRWQRAEDFRFNDLRDVLTKIPDPAFVLLGAPGSGKSTLLRRLQLDRSIDSLRDDTEGITFFVQLNGYRPRADGVLPEPRAWLETRWSERYPNLPPLDTWLRTGKALLLLDAINEMPHRSTAEYHERVSLWRAFAQEASALGNRMIFSCRSLDYSASLSSPEMPVPQVEVQPMNAEQVRRFLSVYIPAHEALIWRELDGSAQFSLFQTPYFLRLLCEQVEATRTVPKGRAALFTGFVRQVLYREINSPLFQPDTLLTERDHIQTANKRWSRPFDLPIEGLLFKQLTQLAFTMQERGLNTGGAQVRINHGDALKLISHERASDIIRAGLALSILDEDIAQHDIMYFHQLLQEYFAARMLAEHPKPELVQVAWKAAPRVFGKIWNALKGVQPTDFVTPLAETLAGLADGDPLPPLPQTGWEETTLTAAPMAKDPNAFIRDLIPHNLPLAARCAAAGETSIDPALSREIQTALIARTQDMTADLRARIAAGEALGVLSDPRFERHTGTYGDALLPPLVSIAGGTYPIGDDTSSYDDEKPAHTVEIAPFQIGVFPVTNAEYALFIEAGGYEDERWWETDEAKAWLRGEGSTEGQKAIWRDNKKTFEGWTEDYIWGLVKQNRITSAQARDWIIIRNWTPERFEQQLEEWYPSGKIYRQPEFWNDARFNNPAQPVVGVTWFEARAYCAWLTANALTSSPALTGQGEKIYRLPTEAEFEAAARGTAGRAFPYGNAFDAARCNTFESHIRRSTPVGIFDNATPEGAFDLSGNAYTWTISIYDQEAYPYPYTADDGRESMTSTGVRRVVRGGSWDSDLSYARASSRFSVYPLGRYFNIGFRLVCSFVPSKAL